MAIDIENPGVNTDDLVEALEALNIIKYVTVDITSAELKAINATPKQIVPAPGAGTYIQGRYFRFLYKYGGVDYEDVSSPALVFAGMDPTDSALNAADPSNMLGGSVSNSCFGYVSVNDYTGATRINFTFTAIGNKAVNFTDLTDWTAGNGTLRITYEYEIVTLPT